MTTRLYYADSLLTRFDATVVDAGSLADGRAFVVLDRTAFYPTSGGQPHDLGRLGGAAVVDVMDREEDGAILHVVDRPVAIGAAVSGELDEARRFDHMQQHTGQHVLSAAFVHAFGAPTVSFHMSADVSTIDVSETLDAGMVTRGEDEANRVIWEDRPVAIRYASAEEAALLPLRKDPKRGGTLRLVDIEKWDLSACGGTHVARTGSIGIIAITGWERYKGGTRVSFVCGRRALVHGRRLRDAMSDATRLLSIQTSELPDAIARLQSDAREAQKQARALGESLAAFEAERLAREAETIHGRAIVARVVDRDGQGLKTLAQAIAALGPAAVLVSQARPALVVAARGGNSALDAGATIKALIVRFGGKGGGRSELAQAGGLDEAPETVCAAARDLMVGR